MLYEFVKAGHIMAVMFWVGGMLITLAALAVTARRAMTAGCTAVTGIILLIDRRLTAPAMGLAWILGLTMVVWAGWLPDGWLIIKLAAVVLLSGLHGLLAGRLRRLSNGADAPGQGLVRIAGGLLFLAVVLAVTMVVTKPL